MSKRILFLGLVLLAVPGCWTKLVYYPDKWPLIEAPTRPAVPTQPAAWTDRENILRDYALKQEALIRGYNNSATTHNSKAGY